MSSTPPSRVPLATEAEPEEELNRFPLSWTGGGDTILYAKFRRPSQADSVVAYVLSDSSRVTLGPLPNRSRKYPAVSVDGRWLAYVSNETGREEVWMRPVYFDPLFGPHSYDVAPDGRFLMVQSDAPRPTEIQVVINFFEELRARVPVRGR